MSSGFVTESEIAEARRIRQAEWEKVRTEDQPLEAPEEEYDSRPLYQRLEEQKQKKDAEYEEAHRLKNMIRGLDDDEVGFLDLVEQTKATAQRQISLEEQKEMREFRERVSSLQESAENQRLAQKLLAPRRGTNTNSIKNKLQGVIVRKRKASDTDQEAPPAKNGFQKTSHAVTNASDKQTNKTPVRNGENITTKNDSGKNGDKSVNNGTEDVNNGNKDVNNGDKSVNNGDKDGHNGDKSVKSEGAAMKCIGVLPGLGHYEDDDTTDSDNSSDSDEMSPKKSPYDLCGRVQDKKREENK